MLKTSRITRNQHPRITSAFVVLLTTAALSGCAGSPSSESAPSPSPTPSLTQQEQDAAAFEAVFAKLVGLSLDEESQDVLSPLVVGDAMRDELAAVQDYRDAGNQVQGKNRYYAFRVTTFDDSFMVAQACLDTSGTRVIDKTGKDVTPERENTVSLQLKAVRGEGGTSWKISDLVKNDGVHACN